MFRESSEADIEAFFKLPEEQQADIIAGVPKSPLTQAIQFMSETFPDTPDGESWLDQRIQKRKRAEQQQKEQWANPWFRYFVYGLSAMLVGTFIFGVYLACTYKQGML